MLPETPDVVVIAAPPQDVPEIVAAAGQKGTAAVIIITARLGHGPGSLAEACEKAARATGLRLVGPNCFGILVPGARLNASFAARMPQGGDLALISQSGAIAAGLVEWAATRAIGFSGVVSLGEHANGSAKRVIDAKGLIVAPGFVDLHTHYDAQIQWDPWCTISGWHGVTTVVLGNCGFGFAPVRPEDRERAMLRMTRNEAIEYDVMALTMPWDWVSFPEFLDSLERSPKDLEKERRVGKTQGENCRKAWQAPW
jgi:hypothetical protein